MKRATRAQVDARSHDLLGVILDGAETWDLVAYVREQEQEEGTPWKLGEGESPMSVSQIMRYRAMAEQLIADSSRTSKKRLLRKHQAQRRRLYAAAVRQGDVRAASAVLKDLAELQGLYPPRKVAPTNPIGDKPYEPLNDDQRAAAIAAVLSRVGPAGSGPDPSGQGGAGGPLLGESGPDHDGRGFATGPLASGPAADDAAEDPAFVLPPGR
jgi:hypothetical protein